MAMVALQIRWVTIKLQPIWRYKSCTCMRRDDLTKILLVWVCCQSSLCCMSLLRQGICPSSCQKFDADPKPSTSHVRTCRLHLSLGNRWRTWNGFLVPSSQTVGLFGRTLLRWYNTCTPTFNWTQSRIHIDISARGGITSKAQTSSLT